MDFSQFADIFKEALILTAVVVGIMLLVDLVRAYTGSLAESGIWKRKRWTIPVAALLGAIPGCVGGYVTVSLYDKRVVPFGAVIAMAIATMGDETFMMLAMFPKTAMIILAGAVVAGIIAGYACAAVKGNDYKASSPTGTVPGHEHAGWKHSLLHALKVSAWALCMMLAIKIAGLYVDLEPLVAGNSAVLVVVAALIGLIPVSGPHMIFVTLFAQGILPLPVLLASCISQEGHAGLPLIASDKKAFVRMKLIKCVLALAAGWIGLLFV